MRHFLKISDLNNEEFLYLLKRTKKIKNSFQSHQQLKTLLDSTLVMIFEKQSTRTRLSFEVGIGQMGGRAVYLNTRDTQLGRGETIEDAAKVISRMCNLVMIRTYEQNTIEKFADNSKVPVINGLTNQYHPCQILADVFTFGFVLTVTDSAVTLSLFSKAPCNLRGSKNRSSTTTSKVIS